MLESLCLRGTPAFGTGCESTIPLTPVTFVFGPNGSGKTTISRAFAQPGRYPGTELRWKSAADQHGVTVYNRDYVNATLRQASNLPGVFTLGEASSDIQADIDLLTGASGPIARAKKQLAALLGSLEANEARIQGVRNELKEASWGKRSDIPDGLQKMFVGYGSSKEKFLGRVLDAAASRESVERTFEDLEVEAAAVLAEDAVSVEELPLMQELKAEDAPGYSLLAVPILGSSDVRLTQLIEQLNNADWVEHGRHFLGNHEELCPFCQQPLPSDLIEQLDAYFDVRYLKQIEQLEAFREQVTKWLASLRPYFDDVLSRSSKGAHLNIEKFQDIRIELEQMAHQLQSAIDTKLNGPSSVVTLPDPSAKVAALNNVVEEANSSIRAFNTRLQNRTASRKKLLDACWVAFAKRTLAKDVGRYEGAMPALAAGKHGLQEKIRENEQLLRESESTLRELQAKVTSSKPIIETINRLLDSVGFHSFRLTESSAIKDGYSLVRENGDFAADTLSEGEQTFITFLYFTQSLQGTPQTADESNDLVAVIDDPISSLDSDVLYAVSTLVRRIIADISARKGRVRQIVLLTHNAHFHKEVTYKAQGDSDRGWQYGIVRKRPGSPSEIVLSKNNPIQTAYASLWEEVKRASQDPNASLPSLQNILRRILETYFKILGGVDTAGILDNFRGVDATICRSLFSWVNAGSHSIFDDIDYSPTASTVESSLRVFQRIFEVQGQVGHYHMMMGIPTPPVSGGDSGDVTSQTELQGPEKADETGPEGSVQFLVA